MLFETLDGINGGLMNTAAITYAASKVAPELVATVRGILGCFLFGGGRLPLHEKGCLIML